MAIIVIDPGHGGTQVVSGSSPNNATGPNGLKEKNVTLEIAVRCAEILNQQGHTIHLTRTDDTNVGLAARARLASTNNANVLVSIHFNGDNSPNTQGTETWVTLASTADSRLLASSLLQRLVAATGYRNRGVKAANWGVLSPGILSPVTAASLIEISFLTNPAEADRLRNRSYIDSLANAISLAILDYINRATSISVRVPTSFPDLSNEGDHTQ